MLMNMAVHSSRYLTRKLLTSYEQVVNRISQQVIEELKFDHASESVSKGIVGLCRDASTGVFYACDESAIFQVSYTYAMLRFHLLHVCSPKRVPFQSILLGVCAR